jgi:uncharacterized protein (DUF2252 family)
LNDAPAVWSCGDLHIENCGGYLGEDGLLYFDIVDFDEAVLAPFLAADLGRLVAWSALRSGGRDGSATIDQLRTFAHSDKWRRRLIDHAEDYRDIACGPRNH